mmetsp:Transcript_98813/g.288250  ORF Transcript_98813/g.288250 Transcript_98813/m.288250 type:complete len:218 (+) Transcript_98813:1389-2042(+)
MKAQTGVPTCCSMGMMLRIRRAEWSGPCALQFVALTLPTPSSSHLATRWPPRPLWTTSILTSRTWPLTTSWRVMRGTVILLPLETAALRDVRDTLGSLSPSCCWPWPETFVQNESATPRKNASKAAKCTRACSVLGILLGSGAWLPAASISWFASSSVRSRSSLLSWAMRRQPKMSWGASFICMSRIWSCKPSEVFAALGSKRSRSSASATSMQRLM